MNLLLVFLPLRVDPFPTEKEVGAEIIESFPLELYPFTNTVYKRYFGSSWVTSTI